MIFDCNLLCTLREVRDESFDAPLTLTGDGLWGGGAVQRPLPHRGPGRTGHLRVAGGYSAQRRQCPASAPVALSPAGGAAGGQRPAAVCRRAARRPLCAGCRLRQCRRAAGPAVPERPRRHPAPEPGPSTPCCARWPTPTSRPGSSARWWPPRWRPSAAITSVCTAWRS